MEYNLKKIYVSMWEHRKNNNFERKSLESTYRGLSVKASIGMTGNFSKIPWISFCAEGQETQKGIYPVLLFYGTPEFLNENKKDTIVKKIVLAYGISATKEPDILWGSAVDNKKTIKEAFTEWDYETADNRINKYNSSYVFKVYDWKEDINFEEIQAAIDEIIDEYLKVIELSAKEKVTIQNIKPLTQDCIKSFNSKDLIKTVMVTGLIYSDTIIKRFAYSLMAKPFVILSGLAGSGKTQLALAFAKCLSDNIEEQVCIVSIGADWTNREPLLGYPNALRSGEYVMPESGVLQLLIRANADQSRPYFLILDEMNLSVVERYFADFLSVMESGENIKLWDGEGNVPKEIALPNNVFIIGTINVDETTYMFSPKVLDRANVIEFKIAPAEMEKYLDEKKDLHLEVAYSACADMAVDFASKAKAQIEIDNQNEKTILLSFFKELRKVNAEFGYRTINEICRFLYFAHKDENGLNDNEAIDAAILQKLLPKLHGSRKKLVPELSSIWKLCLKDNKDSSIDSEFDKNDFIYPESAEKIQRMYNAVVDNGFTSFAEA